MNPGGIRVPLLYNQISGGEQPGEVTYGEAFNVQPFGNTLTVKTCTGAQIQALLEQQFVVQTPPRFLQISWTFSYAWDSTRPAGDKVVNSSVKINGVPIVDAQNYQVTMNNFLADGGDGFSVFRAVHEPDRRRGRPRRLRSLPARAQPRVPAAVPHGTADHEARLSDPKTRWNGGPGRPGPPRFWGYTGSP